MNRVVSILRTPAVALERFDHAPGVAHRDPERERADGHAVSVVERGHFRVRTRGRWRIVPEGTLLVTRPGLEFSCAHDVEHPDDCCLSVGFSDQAIESLRGTGLRPSRALVQPPSNRRGYLARALATCGPGDDARVEALAGALHATLADREAPAFPLFRADRLTWYARRIDAATRLIAAHFDAPLSLTTLAREAGMSTYHFARVFAQLEGRPPHRHLTAVRLAHAEDRLRAGASVTETCFAVGFGSLSHFVTTYRRHFGARPSTVGRRSGRRRHDG